jgi:hypothetical protein
LPLSFETSLELELSHIGFLTGPSLRALIIDTIGWRWIFSDYTHRPGLRLLCRAGAERASAAAVKVD